MGNVTSKCPPKCQGAVSAAAGQELCCQVTNTSRLPPQPPAGEHWHSPLELQTKASLGNMIILGGLLYKTYLCYLTLKILFIFFVYLYIIFIPLLGFARNVAPHCPNAFIVLTFRES